jgi:hypothetical protein
LADIVVDQALASGRHLFRLSFSSGSSLVMLVNGALASRSQGLYIIYHNEL